MKPTGQTISAKLELVSVFAISADSARGKCGKKKPPRTCRPELQCYIIISVKLSMGEKKKR